MTPYAVAWLIVAAAAVLGTVGLVFLTRAMGPSVVRLMIRVLPAILLIVPAPIPGYSGHLAPAFVVLIFEGVFQRDGNPMGAVAVLVATAAVAAGLLILGGRRLSRNTDSAHDDSVTD